MSIDEQEALGASITPSELDESTHAELRLLYQESSVSIRTARDRQWKLVGAALLLLAALVAVPELVNVSDLAAKGLVLSSILISASAIYVLIVYQVWQNTELRRQQTIASHFSSIFAQLGGSEAAREGKLNGYIVLFFMVSTILLGNALVVLLFSRFELQGG